MALNQSSLSPLKRFDKVTALTFGQRVVNACKICNLRINVFNKQGSKSKKQFRADAQVCPYGLST